MRTWQVRSTGNSFFAKGQSWSEVAGKQWEPAGGGLSQSQSATCCLNLQAASFYPSLPLSSLFRSSKCPFVMLAGQVSEGKLSEQWVYAQVRSTDGSQPYFRHFHFCGKDLTHLKPLRQGFSRRGTNASE